MQHLVRIVNTNGASTITVIPWQQPKPSMRILTVFMENDHLTSELYTGKPSKAPKVGRRARFENRFSGK